METKNINRRPRPMVVNKKAVENIGTDTVRNFSRYNSATRNAIGRRIIEMAGEVARPGAGGVYSFGPDHGCGSVPIRVKWRDRFKDIIIVVVGGGIIIIHIFPPIPRPKPNPVADLKELNGAEFTPGAKCGDMRTIDIRRDGKPIGEIRIIAEPLRMEGISRG